MSGIPSTIFADDFIVEAAVEPVIVTATLAYSWRILLVDPLYIFKQELRQKTFTARILEKEVTELSPAEWIPPESH